ncbi:stage III sporulation protein AF [Lottiidibacillus patelloidae]|uniref:Stage III sporulation protein AF n=1 Tax=Lottiidibacillus patelloidae TaxID=2670334 RepID=A0A263BV53_9BACI|nr:stage III sporulation protein AF [Lottiidibacillus patelloidae]OZM57631.1 stage III sporulation protein AF [Lottiidibacillus patelloidae]
MAFLTSWISNIILFVLLAVVLELLLPNSVLQRYVKMVIGLLLIVIILSPLLKFVTEDFEKVLASMSISNNQEEKKIENLIESKKKEIQASQHAYILKQMAVHMKTASEEELMEKYGLVISDIHLTVDENDQGISDEVTQVQVFLSDQLDNEQVAVEVVKRVEIDTSKPKKQETNEPDLKAEEIQELLAYRWGISSEKIVISVERGRK